MANEYLLKEYELCFDQLRFYDTRHDELTRYLFTLTSAVAAAGFAVLEFLKSTTPAFYAALSVLSAIVFLATILLYIAMLQNRLYFVFVARQINAIRLYFLTTEAVAFTANQLYTLADFPAFRIRSLHTIHLIGAALVSSVFAGSTACGLASSMTCAHPSAIALVAACSVACVETVLGVIYLKSGGKKSANDFLRSGKQSPNQSDKPGK